MLALRMLPVAALAAAVAGGPAVADDAQVPKPSYYGHFATEVLAGDTVNVFTLPFKENLLPPSIDANTVRIDWAKPAVALRRFCDKGLLEKIDNPPGPDKTGDRPAVTFRKADPANDAQTLIGVRIPPPPCWWPIQQRAKVTITSPVGESDPKSQARVTQKLFDQEVDVTVFWLPLLITLTVIGFIYPGCALMYGFMRQRNHERERSQRPETEWDKLEEPPSLLASLDPVQLTANPWGRASLGKLQIFMFTLIVFALLLFYLLRSSVLAAMSNDVMLLMGISAVGAVGGKIAFTANRRISFQNWAWLIRHGWLPELPGKRDIAPRAKWSELFLDSETKEFDPYSFQMAIFSVIVAVALAQTSLSGLGTFKIPAELLALLGISHAVFIGGKAIDKGGYRELDDKLDEVRKHELNVAALNAKTDAKPEELAKEKDALRESIAQAAQMFAETYRNQLQGRIPEAAEIAARGGTSAYQILASPAPVQQKPAPPGEAAKPKAVTG